MKLNFTGKNMEITDALRDVTEKKLGKLDKYFQKDIEGNVTFSSEKNRKIIEVTINLPGTIIRAEESTDDMYVSIDKTVDVLERQIRKYKTKLQKRYKNNETIRFEMQWYYIFKYNETIRFENVVPLPVEDDFEKPRLVKRKKFGLKPMSSEEAILQMELLRHNFYVFLDSDNDEVSIVYKRKDGNYGLIEPEL